MVKTFRPRISRVQRDRLEEVATALNGDEVATFARSLDLVCGYLEVLQGDIDECPDCGSELLDWRPRAGSQQPVELPEGKWFCEDCPDVIDVWDYLNVDDRETAQLPGLPNGIRYSFECDHCDERTGTKSP